ncbi:hypothetical protein EJ02DRAFT_437173 [Clathrospora elynae]|uniref:Uncharacterized protein n=1 Tax=Clathrospora elynae TaxID=706981 RepID=A0A6A5SF49_9PLEO|nr:hypothetical protein EJ02DRAFT_437173 [Clathrospora elynae]
MAAFALPQEAVSRSAQDIEAQIRAQFQNSKANPEVVATGQPQPEPVVREGTENTTWNPQRMNHEVLTGSQLFGAMADTKAEKATTPAQVVASTQVPFVGASPPGDDDPSSENDKMDDEPIVPEPKKPESPVPRKPVSSVPEKPLEPVSNSDVTQATPAVSHSNAPPAPTSTADVSTRAPAPTVRPLARFTTVLSGISPGWQPDLDGFPLPGMSNYPAVRPAHPHPASAENSRNTLLGCSTFTMGSRKHKKPLDNVDSMGNGGHDDSFDPPHDSNHDDLDPPPNVGAAQVATSTTVPIVVVPTPPITSTSPVGDIEMGDAEPATPMDAQTTGAAPLGSTEPIDNDMTDSRSMEDGMDVDFDSIALPPLPIFPSVQSATKIPTPQSFISPVAPSPGTPTTPTTVHQ